VIVVLAIGVSACVALPAAGIVAAIWWCRSRLQGRRLARAGGGQ
jgi:hypothetical protein